jgi:DNA-binding transcriptional ArsR family regulator
MDHALIERISKALADKTRLLVFEAISSCESMNCGELVSLRGVTPPTISHHLKILADAGLIKSKRKGQFVYNKSNPKTLSAYTLALTSLAKRKKNRRRVSKKNTADD